MLISRLAPAALLACTSLETAPTDGSSGDTATPGVAVPAGAHAAMAVDFDGDGTDALILATAETLLSYAVSVDGNGLSLTERGRFDVAMGGWAAGRLLPSGTGLFVMNARGDLMQVLGNRLEWMWEGTLGAELPVGSVLPARMDTDPDDDLTLVSADETTLLRLRNDGRDGWQVDRSFSGSFTDFRWVAAGPLLGGERDDIVVVGPQLLVTTARDEDFVYTLDEVLQDEPQVDAVVADLDGSPHLVSATRRSVTSWVGDLDSPAQFREVSRVDGLTRVRRLVRIPGPAGDAIGVAHADGFEILRGSDLRSDGVAPMVRDSEAVAVRVDGEGEAVVLQLELGEGRVSQLVR